MVMITALAITRERESGTMENLLSMPTRPFEVMIGKIIPYIARRLHPGRPAAHRRPLSLSCADGGQHPFCCWPCALVFIAANLSMGITFSTIAQNQRQAMQMGMFFFLPSILLSGFMFPFRGMPHWAQTRRRNPAADPFPARRARHLAQRKRICGNRYRISGPSPFSPPSC